MRARILVAALLCSCSSNDTGGEKGAQFRFVARDVYTSVYSPSCSAPPGFKREAMLRNELASLNAFEDKLVGTLAAQQLAFAKQDSAYERKAEGSCTIDDDIGFAIKHIDMTREAVRIGLSKMRELSGSLGTAESSGQADATDRSDFRYKVRRLVAFSRPMCPLSSRGKNDQIFGPARREIGLFKMALRHSPFARHFEIADADVDYEQSITYVSCFNPSNESLAQLSSLALESVRKQIASIRQSMQK